MREAAPLHQLCLIDSNLSVPLALLDPSILTIPSSASHTHTAYRLRGQKGPFLHYLLGSVLVKMNCHGQRNLGISLNRRVIEHLRSSQLSMRIDVGRTPKEYGSWRRCMRL